jgi:ABC-2 type transport system ATP-binding protein
MGSGSYVGRVGALAVALGIGAAVATGQGVASAKPADKGAADTSTSSAAKSDSTTASDAAKGGEPNSENPKSEKPSPTTDSADTDATTDTSGDSDTPKRKKRSRIERDTPTGRTAGATAVVKDAVEKGVKDAVEKGVEKSIEKADQSTLRGIAPAAVVAASGATAATVAHRAVSTATIADTTPAAETPVPHKDPITVGLASLVSAIISPFAGNGTDPATPDTPAVWALAAASRREFLGGAADLNKAAAPTAVSAPGTVAADDIPDPPTTVTAIPSVPVFTQLGLQRIPILGPLAITPIIAIVHSIPLVGDILHPFIGYPLGMTGGTTPRDVKVISFDGTPIYVHFFPAQNLPSGTTTAPTILNGPGLGLPGETNPLAVDNPFLANQVVGMATLLQNGYNVVTWDPRGEWGSKGGTLEIDNPNVEARDMQAIISWVAQQPEAAFDPGSTTDPLIGMVGASYGGGIQLVTAAIDKRVDAIVPTIAWNNLNSSLDKAGAPKTSWGLFLGVALILTGSNTDSRAYATLVDALFTGRVPDASKEFLDESGPDYLLDRIEAPALLFEGTVDTLFTLKEADLNAKALIGNGVPTKVVWYCGGHGGCITSTNDGEVVDRATMAWLDKYVKGLPVSTGPQFEWVDQHGRNFSSDTYPVPTGTPIEATRDERDSLPLSLFLGGSGPNFAAFNGGLVNGLLGFLSGAKASNAVELTIDPQDTTTYIVGEPTLDFTYSGTGKNPFVYAQLVDDSTGLVLGNQVTPIPVLLDGKEHQASVPLEMVAHTLAPGQTVTLQIVASAVTYQPLKGGGNVTISDIKLTLPTADPTKISVVDAQAGAA